MNKTLQSEIQKDYDTRPEPKTTELELSFGHYIYPQKKFEANIPENIFNHVMTKLFSKAKPTQSRSVIYRLAKEPKQAYELFLNPKNEITLHLKKTKENKKTYNLYEQSARISVSTEITSPIKSKNSSKSSHHLPKGKLSFFRLKDRKSYVHKDFPNWQFDFTMGTQLNNPNEQLEKLIETQTKLPPTYYQIEIEYIPPQLTKKSSKPTLIPTLTKLLQTLTPKLIPTDPTQSLLTKFRVPQLSKLMTQVMVVTPANVKQLAQNYAVTEKADGLRLLLYITEFGQLLTINKSNTIDIPPPKANPSTTTKLSDKLHNTLLDTEFIPELNRYLIFDILMHNNTQTTTKPFEERYKLLQSLTPHLPKQTTVKTFLTPTKTLSIYEQAKKIYQPKKYKYELDGLIFTPTDKPYSESSLKWKPLDEITVDFLTVVTPTTATKVKLHYFIVAARKQVKYQRGRLKIAPQSLVPFANKTKQFVPILPPFPNTAEITLTKSKNSSDPIYKPTNTTIKNLTIIECQYNHETKTWLPYRNRDDKTEQMRFNLTQSPPDFFGPNGLRTTELNWELIQNPITTDMITGKAPLPEVYYTGTAVKNSQIKEMNHFHHYVKNYLYFTFTKRVPSTTNPPQLNMIEFSGGRGGDLPTIDKLQPQTLVFTDYDQTALNSAESKWERVKRQSKNTQATFLQTDLREDVTAKLKPHIPSQVRINFISIQFAFHYMMQTKKSFENMFKNVNTYLTKGGIFLLTTFDGETIVNLLKSNKTMALYSNTNSTRLLFKIEKRFKNSKTNSNSNSNSSPFGKEISVYGETIGEHPEYLVPFDFLINHFTTNGYKVLESNQFTYLLPRWKKKTGKNLTQAEFNFSKLNRYIVFQKL